MKARAIEVVVDALRANGKMVKDLGGDRYAAQCPGHDDHDPSLSISLRKDGKGVVIYCHTGCDYRHVLVAVGLIEGDLFDDPQMRHAYRPTNTYRYSDGRRVHRKPDKSFPQSGNTKGSALFGVEEIGDAELVFVPEGEKDVLAIRAAGGVAVCSAMGAGKAHLADWSALTMDVVVVADRDEPGRKHAADVASLLTGIARSIRTVRAAVGKDAADHIAAGLGLHEFVPVGLHDTATNNQHPDDSGEPPGGIEHTAHLGMAVELARRHNRKLLHVHGIGWHYWDGTRWAADDTGAAQRAVYATLGAVWRDAFTASPERRKEIARMVTQCETANGVLGVLTLARALPEFAATVRDLDADPWLLNCANGTLDLRTGERRRHDPADRITRITNAAYRPDTRSSEWTQFLERILPDANVRGYVQRVIGLSLLGEVNGDKQLAPICYGDGANGKSTFRETICHTLGDYASAADPSLLIMRRGDVHPTGQADLLGRRLVTTTETEQGARLDLALLKRLTGGDKLKARFMHKDFFEFTPSHLLLMFTNHKPVIDDDTEAVWRRIRVIPFTVTIPQDERDGDLGDRLLAHADAVLTWIIDGWNAYRRGGLAEPPAVLLATGDYRDESDTIGRFINERCHTGGAQSSSTTAVLWHAFAKWCTDEGTTTKIGKREFGRELDRKGFECDPATHGWRRRRICLRHNNDDNDDHQLEPKPRLPAQNK